MSRQEKDIQAIFSEAIGKQTEEESSTYLDQICGDDTNLRDKVENLLKARREASGLLESTGFDSELALELPLTEQPGTVIGRYKLLEQIGQGGMAVVYRAEQQRPIRRYVALKIIKLGMDTKQVIARFEAERQALAMMDHPGIAKVLDAGATDAGRPYFVMELVKGASITDFCDASRLITEERLELFVSVCQAVQHAHQKGIIHRDIKPSNVMVAEHDGKPVPKVIDFGIAKAINRRLTEKTLYTYHAQMIGTPAYMSPEQAEPDDTDIDIRTDIFSLGTLLYELLTGSPPFTSDYLLSKSYKEMQRIIREEEPVRPSTKISAGSETMIDVAKRRRSNPDALQKLIRADLDWVVMKTLEKDRNRRYDSASEFAADIRRYLNNEPVLAGPPSATYRLKKFIQRRRGLVGAAATVAATLLIGLVVSTAMYFRSEKALKGEAVAHAQTQQAKDREESERIRAEEAEKTFHAHLLASQAQLMIEQQANLLQRSVLLAVESMQRLPSLDADQALRRGLALLPRHVATFARHTSAVCTVAFSPDGKYVATGSWDFSARLWETETGKELARMNHARSVRSVAFSPDGKRLVTAGRDGTARVWDTVTGKELLRMHHDNDVRAAVFSPDPNGKHVATGSLDKTARLWDARSGAELARMNHTDAVWAVAFTPDGKLLATGGNDDTARLWDVGTGKQLACMNHAGDVHSLTFSPDGRYLATASLDHTARLWNVSSGEELMSMAHGHEVRSVAFSPDGSYLATASYDKTARIWDVRHKPRELMRIGHDRHVISALFSPDGKYLATASEGGNARVWHVANGKEVGRMNHENLVLAIAFSPDGQYLATASMDKTAHIWEATRRPHEVRMHHDNRVLSVGFSPDGRHLASSSSDKTTRVWEAASGKELTRIAHEGWVNCLAFSPNGRYLATAATDGTARLCQASGGEEFVRVSHDGEVRSVAFSPNGDYLITGSLDKTARVWQVSSGKELARMSDEADVLAVAFGPNGKRVATGDRDGIMKVWEWAGGKELARMKHDSAVYSVTFSSNGEYLATASLDGTARVWQTSSGRELARMNHESHVTCVAFSPDEKYLATASVDTFARVWKWADGKEIARMRHDDFVEAVTLSPDPEGRYLATASDDGTVRINYWRPDDLIAQARARLARNLTYREWQEHFGEEPYHKTCPDLPIDPGFVQAGRDLAKRGDFEGALAIFHRAVQLEPGLALDPEAEVQRITAAQTTAK